MSNKIRAGIIGGAGYTGGELSRLLLRHPHTELVFVQSGSHAGQPLWAAHRDLYGMTMLSFSDETADADVVFLCGSHGQSEALLTRFPVKQHNRIIDLSQDFRLSSRSTCNGRSFVYGLPEFNRERIKAAMQVANPGCFATAIQLALLPSASAGLLNDDVHVQAVTGSTGAGQKPTDTTHFSWRSANHSVYKAFDHQHLAEIGETLAEAQPGIQAGLNFIPSRGGFARGILATAYFRCSWSEEALTTLYRDYYNVHPFVQVVPFAADVKQVTNTNMAFLQVEKKGEFLFVTSVIDNLLKGASGQAVQNMNLMFGLPEISGLDLKPSAF